MVMAALSRVRDQHLERDSRQLLRLVAAGTRIDQLISPQLEAPVPSTEGGDWVWYGVMIGLSAASANARVIISKAP